MLEFKLWKEREEECTYTTYVQQTRGNRPVLSEGIISLCALIYLHNYIAELTIISFLLLHVAIIAVYYYCCCRDGHYQQNHHNRKTTETRPHQKPSRKLNAVCISRMYVTEYTDGHIEVKYITAHSGHELGAKELAFLPLPKSTKESVAVKVSQGIPAERIQERKIILKNNDKNNINRNYYYKMLEKMLVIEQNVKTLHKLYHESTS